MKHICAVFLIFQLLIISSTNGQKPLIELSFTATENNLHVPLDSVLVMNLSTGTDTVIYAPDTVLLIDYYIGIDDESFLTKNSFFLFQNHPNPFIDHTKIKVWLPGRDVVTLHIRDLLGRPVTELNKELDEGFHTFIFYPGNEDIYLLSATCRGVSHSLKLFNRSLSSMNVCSIEYSDSYQEANIHKVTSYSDHFTYSKGDHLRFMGYATTSEGYVGGDYEDAKPIASTTYFFTIQNGIPCADVPLLNVGDKSYRTIQIGPQCWFRENADHPATGRDTEKKIKTAYGKLYIWDKAMNVCPEGWHLPTSDEWDALGAMLGGPWVAGAELKDTGTTDWNPPNTGATNSTGFTGLPGGYHDDHHDLWEIGDKGMFWSSTEGTGDAAWAYGLFTEATELHHNGAPKSYGFSVRCIKD